MVLLNHFADPSLVNMCFEVTHLFVLLLYDYFVQWFEIAISLKLICEWSILERAILQNSDRQRN